MLKGEGGVWGMSRVELGARLWMSVNDISYERVKEEHTRFHRFRFLVFCFLYARHVCTRRRRLFELI